MSTIYKLGSEPNYINHVHYLVDADKEPERATGCTQIFMSVEQAKELALYLFEWSVRGPCVAITLHTGKRKKGNPVLGDPIYE